MRRAVRAAAARLRIDSATAEVFRTLDAAAVESILLKGASNRQWLWDGAEAPGMRIATYLSGPGTGR